MAWFMPATAAWSYISAWWRNRMAQRAQQQQRQRQQQQQRQQHGPFQQDQLEGTDATWYWKCIQVVMFPAVFHRVVSHLGVWWYADIMLYELCWLVFIGVALFTSAFVGLPSTVPYYVSYVLSLVVWAVREGFEELDFTLSDESTSEVAKLIALPLWVLLGVGHCLDFVLSPFLSVILTFWKVFVVFPVEIGAKLLLACLGMMPGLWPLLPAMGYTGNAFDFFLWQVLKFAISAPVALFMHTVGVYVMPPYIFQDLSLYSCNAPGALRGQKQPPFWGVYGPTEQTVVWVHWWESLEWGLARRFPRFWQRMGIGVKQYGGQTLMMREKLPHAWWFDVVLGVWLWVVVRHIHRVSSGYYSNRGSSGGGGSQGQRQVGRDGAGSGSSGVSRQARRAAAAAAGQQKNKAAQRNQPKRKQRAH